MRSFDQKLKNLPSSPGVYQFLSKDGEILYVGKAKNLKNRVRQYFSGHDEREQIPFLLKEVANFDYTIVTTEVESLYLERTLIQKHHPKYNIDLRDDKNYAFITIDYQSPIPQIGYSRKIDTGLRTDKPSTGIVYFGPYTAAYKIRDTLNAVRRIFAFCANEKPGTKPCFYYHLHRCPGVCVGDMSLSDYAQHIEKIRLFLSGKIGPTKKVILRDMQAAATDKKFEKAAKLRDQLRAVEMLEARQNMILTKPVNWDIVGLAFDEGMAAANVFKIREGKLLDKINFVYAAHQSGLLAEKTTAVGDILQHFLEDYYAQTSDAPKEIVLPQETPDADLIKKLIRERFHTAVTLRTAKKGQASTLRALSKTNAQEYLKNWLSDRAGHLDKVQRGLQQLQVNLNLPALPKRIECYDISNTQGTNPVGSMVVFEHGLPKKSEYRKFKIRGKNTPDDFEMMREMLSRRLSRSINYELRSMEKGAWPLPDLIVIDGGKGQLNAALSTLQATRYQLHPIPLIGLAKRIEEIFVPGEKEPILLSHDNPGLQLLQRLRDEAHRFGITFHRKLRSKQAVRSALDDIPGIGPKTKKLLKQKFGTVQDIKKASLEALASVVGTQLARTLKQNL